MIKEKDKVRLVDYSGLTSLSPDKIYYVEQVIEDKLKLYGKENLYYTNRFRKIETYKEGDLISIQLEGTVMRVSNSHGVCYEVLLNQRDFVGQRLILVDEEEVDSKIVDGF